MIAVQKSNFLFVPTQHHVGPLKSVGFHISADALPCPLRLSDTPRSAEPAGYPVGFSALSSQSQAALLTFAFLLADVMQPHLLS